jgi:hypothetical protein
VLIVITTFVVYFFDSDLSFPFLFLIIVFCLWLLGYVSSSYFLIRTGREEFSKRNIKKISLKIKKEVREGDTTALIGLREAEEGGDGFMEGVGERMGRVRGHCFGMYGAVFYSLFLYLFMCVNVLMLKYDIFDI